MTTINIFAAKTSELVAFYNMHSGKPAIKKFADRATAEKRVAELVATLKPVQRKVNVDKAEKKVAGKMKSILPMTIKLIVDHNPKREGTAAYDRFAVYRDGMTTSEFKAAGGLAADLIWDCNHGYIALS